MLFRIRLKELREQAGYSQYSLADAFGISQSTIGNWEAGKREPNFETMQRLADFFGVTVDYLLGRDTEKAPAPDGERQVSDEDIKFALFGGSGKEITDAMYDEVKKFAAYVKQREDKKGE